MITATQMVNL